MPMEPVFKNLSKEEAEIFTLILYSKKIPFDFSENDGQFEITAPKKEHEKIKKQISLYLAENQPPRDLPSDTGRKTLAGLGASILLAIFYLKFGPLLFDHPLIKAKGADAGQMLQGEWWRGITAIFLHMDISHLLGNMAGIYIFATGVSVRLGWGVGLLLVLLTGFAGNVATALFYHTGHLSVGASTCVFSALGILSGIKLLESRKKEFFSIKQAVLATGACFALLGLLGVSPNADLVAHLSGLLAGLGAGLCFNLLFPELLPEKVQIYSGVLATFIIIFSFSFN